MTGHIAFLFSLVLFIQELLLNNAYTADRMSFSSSSCNRMWLKISISANLKGTHIVLQKYANMQKQCTFLDH